MIGLDWRVKVRPPLVAALVTLAPGLLGLITGRLLLFPSLAPSAVLQAHSPEHASSRPYNLIVSHLLGMGVAFMMVWMLGLAHSPSVFQVHRLSAARVAAAVLAVFLGTLLEIVLGAPHAPAASTTLLVALGSLPLGWPSAGLITAGVLVTAGVGEAGRRYQLLRRARHQVMS